MAYRWHPKNSETDPDSPRAWAAADCCGFIWPLHKLQWQYSYAGTVNPQNTRFLVCPKHIDPLNPQDMPYILPPDPLPIFNARPENYTIDQRGPQQDLNAILIVHLGILANIDITGAAAFGQWDFTDPEQSGELMTAGII